MNVEYSWFTNINIMYQLVRQEEHWDSNFKLIDVISLSEHIYLQLAVSCLSGTYQAAVMQEVDLISSPAAKSLLQAQLTVKINFIFACM